MSLIYPKLLGEQWRSIAAALRVAHESDHNHGKGSMRITYAAGRIAVLFRSLFRLPAPGDSSVTLLIEPQGERERWVRTFDRGQMATWQRATRDGLLAERFGMIELRFRLEAAPDSIRYRQVSAALAIGPVRLPLPRRFAPQVSATETAAGERKVHVDVRIDAPGIPEFMRYNGDIEFGERES